MGTNVRKLLNLIVISGERRHFIFWSKKFELYVYFTPIKKRVVDYKTYNIKIKDLNVEFNIGDPIQVLIDWANKNKHDYSLIERHAD